MEKRDDASWMNAWFLWFKHLPRVSIKAACYGCFIIHRTTYLESSFLPSCLVNVKLLFKKKCSNKCKCIHVKKFPKPLQQPQVPPQRHQSPHYTQPINTSQSPVTDGCRGHQRLAGAGRGLAKVRQGHWGVWDCCDMACLLVSMQVDE